MPIHGRTSDHGVHVPGNAIPMCTPALLHAAGRLTVIHSRRSGGAAPLHGSLREGCWATRHLSCTVADHQFAGHPSRCVCAIVSVSEVTSADVLEILTPIWHTKAPMARYVHNRIRAVLEWAIAMDWRTDNPCDRLLPVLGSQHDVVEHRRALPHREVAAAIETVRESTVPAALKLAFEFLVLTAARSVARCGARSTGEYSATGGTRRGRCPMKYAIVIERTLNGYSAHVPDLPVCVAAADSYENAEELIREAVISHLESLRGQGDPMPEPRTSVGSVESFRCAIGASSDQPTILACGRAADGALAARLALVCPPLWSHVGGQTGITCRESTAGKLRGP